MQLPELNKKLIRARNALNSLTLSCIVLNNAINKAVDVTDVARLMEDPPSEEQVAEAIAVFNTAFPLFTNSLEKFEDAMDNMVGGAK